LCAVALVFFSLLFSSANSIAAVWVVVVVVEEHQFSAASSSSRAEPKKYRPLPSLCVYKSKLAKKDVNSDSLQSICCVIVICLLLLLLRWSVCFPVFLFWVWVCSLIKM
jgi:hypothetical protein